MKEINEKLLTKQFEDYFKESPEHYFEMGGRFEIIGNHTDHNHGMCMVGTCDLLIAASVKKTDDGIIRLSSNGYQEIYIDTSRIALNKGEFGNSTGLIKGVMDYLTRAGYKVGGFIAKADSNIPQGSGLSSSAAYELLIGEIFNKLYNDNSIDKLILAKAGQYSENNYFGKKSGLLDQIGVSYGGINVIDFKNIENPTIANIEFPFKDIHFVLVNTGGSHANLSSYYSSIPESMWNVAEHFGKKYLRDVPEAYFQGELDEEKEHGHSHFEYIDKKRATHFYEENKRVLACLKAIKEGNEEEFLKQINASQSSSQNNLCNTQVENNYAGSPQEAVDLANAYMSKGAAKINGGGFAGTVICFVHSDELDNFISKMSKRYGEGNVFELHLKTY